MPSYEAQQGTKFNFDMDSSKVLVVETKTEPEKVEFCVPSESTVARYCHWKVELPMQDVVEFVLNRMAIGQLRQRIEEAIDRILADENVPRPMLKEVLQGLADDCMKERP